MRLISDWHQAWRWASIRLIAASAAIQLVIISFPAELTAFIPAWLMQTMAIGCLVGAILGRITTGDTHGHDPEPLERD